MMKLIRPACLALVFMVSGCGGSGGSGTSTPPPNQPPAVSGQSSLAASSPSSSAQSSSQSQAPASSSLDQQASASSEASQAVSSADAMPASSASSQASTASAASQPLALIPVIDPDSQGVSARPTSALAVPVAGENYLGSLRWLHAANERGLVGVDETSLAPDNTSRHTLRLNSQNHTQGLGVYGNSTITYALNQQCTLFNARIGVSSRVGTQNLAGAGSLIFEVWGDDENLFTSGVMTASSPSRLLELPISGVNELRLVTRNNGVAGSAQDSHMDYGAWAMARVTCNAPQAPAWTFCANEHQRCEFSGTRQVRYGADGHYTILTLTAENGGVMCGNAVFGDPAPGLPKSCAVDGNSTPSLLPNIAHFSATPPSIAPGQTSHLSWEVSNAQSLSINRGIGTVDGNGITVQPDTTTSYTLTATNEHGSSTRTLQVTVDAGGPDVTAVPVIESFIATPASITAGQATVLTWQVTGATSLSISPGIGAVTGNSRNVSPGVTTSYTLTATNSLGSASRSVQVTVTPLAESDWTHCANEWQFCDVPSGRRDVRFGANGQYVVRDIGADSWFQCSENTFGPTPREPNRTCAYGPVKMADVAPPSYDMSGMGPYIDINRIPQGAPGHGTLRINNSNDFPTPSDDGAFRTVCAFSHFNFDDAIVYPGQPGRAHLHMYFGNTLANAHSTAESLRNTGNSTCRGGIANRSAYWIPAVIDTRTGTPVLPRHVDFYYKSGWSVQPQNIQVFPAGLRMIAGNAMAASGTTPEYQNGVYHWDCYDNHNARGPSIPNCQAGDQVLLTVVFPQCWDGVNLDSPDHKSHMAYPLGNWENNGRCPTTHPVPIPVITLNITFPVTEAGQAQHWRLSSDMYSTASPGGYSAHADWFDGWNQEVKETFIEHCVRARMDCGSHRLGDGRTIE